MTEQNNGSTNKIKKDDEGEKKLSSEREKILRPKPFRSIEKSKSSEIGQLPNSEKIDSAQMCSMIENFPYLSPMFYRKCKSLTKDERKKLVEDFNELFTAKNSLSLLSLPLICLLISVEKQHLLTKEEFEVHKNENTSLDSKDSKDSEIEQKRENSERKHPFNLNKALLEIRKPFNMGGVKKNLVMTRKIALQYLEDLADALHCSDSEAVGLFFGFCLEGGTSQTFSFKSSFPYTLDGASRSCEKKDISDILANRFCTGDRNKDLKNLAKKLAFEISSFAEERFIRGHLSDIIDDELVIEGFDLLTDRQASHANSFCQGEKFMLAKDDLRFVAKRLALNSKKRKEAREKVEKS